jgi:hypothetical protein
VQYRDEQSVAWYQNILTRALKTNTVKSKAVKKMREKKNTQVEQWLARWPDKMTSLHDAHEVLGK